MITGKQRSYLKKLAHGMKPVVQIGRSELTENVIKAVDDALSARELIKVSIGQGVELDAAQVCADLAEKLHAEFIQAIGRRFVLYRRARDPEKRRIVLP